jgi:hypothetical protein
MVRLSAISGDAVRVWYMVEWYQQIGFCSNFSFIPTLPVLFQDDLCAHCILINAM